MWVTLQYLLIESMQNHYCLIYREDSVKWPQGLHAPYPTVIYQYFGVCPLSTAAK